MGISQHTEDSGSRSGIGKGSARRGDPGCIFRTGIPQRFRCDSLPHSRSRARACGRYGAVLSESGRPAPHAPRPPPEPPLGRIELHALADRLRTPAPDAHAVEQCVAFVEAASLQLGHGRARALMSRRLKHCRPPLTDDPRERRLRAILRRLYSGRFVQRFAAVRSSSQQFAAVRSSSQQFEDQLRLALSLDAARVREAAARSRRSDLRRTGRTPRGLRADRSARNRARPATCARVRNGSDRRQRRA